MQGLKAASLAVALLAPAAAPADVVQVTSRSEFVRLVDGRTLSTLGVRLRVSPAGQITGSAWGRQVSGTWRWQDGYFCREMTFGDKPIAADCQVVTREGDRLRFIAQRGEGQQASLTLR